MIADTATRVSFFPWQRQNPTTGALGNIKAWYEAIGLKAGPILPPVPTASPEVKARIKARLQEIGVA